MDTFIHQENLALFRRRLAESTLTEAHRKVILLLLAEEQAKRLPQIGADDGSG